MKKRSVLLIDPDESHRKQISDLLKTSPTFLLIGDCSNAKEGILYINALEPQLVLMDIDLPGGSGFDILSEANHIPAVIFTTRTDAYAFQAFEYNAIDYLLKPYPRERLEIALEKYLRLDSTTNNNHFIFHQQKTELPNRILVESGKRHKSISLDDITYFKADKDYTWVNTFENQAYLCSTGIGSIEKKLDPNRFIRIHRSFIVNIDHIMGCYRDITKLFIILPYGVDICVGRKYLPNVKRMFF
jgi:two-component system LytT family response regulator